MPQPMTLRAPPTAPRPYIAVGMERTPVAKMTLIIVSQCVLVSTMRMLTFQEDHTGFDPAHEAKLHPVRRRLEHFTIIVGHEFDRASANAGAIRAGLYRLDVFLVVAHRRDILEMQRYKGRRSVARTDAPSRNAQLSSESGGGSTKYNSTQCATDSRAYRNDQHKRMYVQ